MKNRLSNLWGVFLSRVLQDRDTRDDVLLDMPRTAAEQEFCEHIKVITKRLQLNKVKHELEDPGAAKELDVILADLDNAIRRFNNGETE